MRQKTIYFLSFLTFILCSNDMKKSNSGTHKVVCNRAHLRAFPNFNSKSLGIIEAGEPIIYIKESKYKEKIKINNQEPIANWIYCSYNNKQGWIYGGCLEVTDNQSFNRQKDSNLYLSNRIIAYQEVPDDFENSPNADKSKCFFSSEGDCGGGDLIFLNEKEVIIAFYCCCSSSSYRKGTYNVVQDEVICRFGNTEIFADDPNGEGKFKVEKKFIDPIVFDFTIQYCNTGEIYLQNKMDKEEGSTYGVFSSETVKKVIDKIKEEKAWEYLR